MREPLKDAGRLEHILTAINNAIEFLDGKTIEILQNDKILFFAVVKNIEIIGEASYMLSKDFKRLHPETPWRHIEGMRHILVHEYYQIEPIELWNVVEQDLPTLKIQIEYYISNSVK